MAKAAALILCTVLDDRELHRRLDGYADDAQRIGHRLVSWLGQNFAFARGADAIPVKA
jgi:hypothetical protein